MEVKDFLSMNGGVGENSYAHNSRFAVWFSFLLLMIRLQFYIYRPFFLDLFFAAFNCDHSGKVLARTKPYFVEAIEDLLQDQVPLKLLRAADLGSSCGQNVISIMAAIMDTVEVMHRKVDKEPPELQFLLNDLPSNDFNSLFRGLPSFLQRGADNKGGLLPCYVMGVPGSFHGRLFPNNDLHFVYALYSVHWLSQAPAELVTQEGEAINSGSIYISKTSPPCVWKAYLNQFEKDFCALLKCRYEEMVVNGRMLLMLHSRPNADAMKDNVYPWHLLSKALSEMVSQGLVEEKRLDNWNVPYYTASMEEVKDIVEREGSFLIQKLETLKLQCGEETEDDIWVNAQKQAKNVRCFTETLIAQQFGEKIIEYLYDRLAQLIVEALDNEGTYGTSLIVVLKRK